MAYRVLSEHKYSFARSEGRARKGCAPEATGLSNSKTAQETAEEATAYNANNLNQYTSIQTGEETAFVPTFDADGKAPDGCKGDWTNAQHLPEGRGAVGRLRVNICESPRRLVGGLAKCVAFAPQGRGRNGVRPSQHGQPQQRNPRAG